MARTRGAAPSSSRRRSVSTSGHNHNTVRSARRSLKVPRISNTSPQDVRLELDALEHVERAQQQTSSWSLQFTDRAMEQRFQLYHEDVSLRSSRIGCACTFTGLVVMQVGAFFADDRRDDALDSHPMALAFVGVALTTVAIALWIGVCYATRRTVASGLHGRVQSALFVVGLCVVLVVLVQPAFAYTSTTDRAEPHALTQTMLFLLMALSAIATVWHVQFVLFVAVAAVAALVLGGWLAADRGAYVTQHWHVAVLFAASVGMLGRALYRSERTQRLKFLRLRHLMLENLKLLQQNTFMQQQLSSHVDAIGIHDHHTERLSHSRSAGAIGAMVDHRPFEPLNGAAGSRFDAGESSMENVLKVLYQLKLQVGSTNDDMSRDLDFVMQTLTSEQDLLLEYRMKRGRGGTTPTSHVDADAGWLTLLEAQRHRRRRSCDLGVMLDVPVVKTIRRTDSGLRQTVLKQVETYLLAGQRRGLLPHALAAAAAVDAVTAAKSASTGQLQPPPPTLLSSTDAWTAQKLLTRALRSDEIDMLGFAKTCLFPLTSVLLTTLESHNLFVELPVRIECAAEYGLEIESRYQAKNPYHNAVHAASVVWDINFFLRRLQQPVAALHVFAALVAGAVHDVNHPGMSNAYLVATSSPLAIKYSDDSVLERMHLAEAFQAATKDGCDIFEGFSTDLKRQSRQMIIKMVLATDLSGHLKHVNWLKSKRYAMHSTSSSDLMAPTPPSACSGATALPDDLVFHSIIMMADLGHAFKSFNAHYAWSKLVAEEFFRQGDTERQFGMPISPLCDRRSSRFERSQIGFLEFVVLPLYTAVRDVLALTDFDTVLDRVEENMAIWKHRAEQLEQSNTDAVSGGDPPTDGSVAAATVQSPKQPQTRLTAKVSSSSSLKGACAGSIPELSEGDDGGGGSDADLFADASSVPDGEEMPAALHIVVTDSSTRSDQH